MKIEIEEVNLFMKQIQLWVWNRSHKYNGYYSSTKEQSIENMKKNMFKFFYINRIVDNDPNEEISLLLISNVEKLMNLENAIDYLNLIRFMDKVFENTLSRLATWEKIEKSEIKYQLNEEYLEWKSSNKK